MYEIKQPVKKNDVYVSRVTKDNAPVRINIPFTRIVQKNDRVLYLWIPDESPVAETINKCDSYCLEQTILHAANEWFSTELTTDSINAYFRRSVSRNVLSTVCSEVRPPQVTYRRKVVDDIPDRGLCTVQLEIQGLYFMKKRFGIRWLVTHIQIEDDDQEENERVDVHREEVEESWAAEVRALSAKIQTDIVNLHKKIDILETLEHDMKKLLINAKSCETCGKEWETSFSELSKKASKYCNGTIFIYNKI
jgi:Family of unknown function (DUF5871)